MFKSVSRIFFRTHRGYGWQFHLWICKPLHKGSSKPLMVERCLLRVQWPVSKPTALPMLLQLSPSSSLWRELGQPELSSLACLWSVELSHSLYCWTLKEIPKAGSGPVKGVPDPNLAKSSAGRQTLHFHGGGCLIYCRRFLRGGLGLERILKTPLSNPV